MNQIGGQQRGLTSGLGESARGVIKPGIVAEWIASAQHRDVLIYARCEHLARGGAVGLLMRQYQEQGLVELTQRRMGRSSIFAHRAFRTAVPLRARDRKAAPPRRIDPAQADVLSIVQDADPRLGRIATAETIGAEVFGGSTARARKVLDELRERGLVQFLAARSSWIAAGVQA